MVIRDLLWKVSGSDPTGTLARHATGTFVVRVAGVVVALGVHLLLARIMGAEQYGIYAYVISWLGILVLLGCMGLHTVVLRFASVYNALREWELLKGILIRSSQIILLVSACISAILVALVWSFSGVLPGDLIRTFLVGAAVLPVISLLYICQEALRSLGRVVLAQLPLLLVHPIVLAAFVMIAFLVFSHRVKGPLAMAFYLVATVISLILAAIWLWGNLPDQAKASNPEYKSRQWVMMALPLVVVSGFHFLNTRCDVLMIGIFLGTKQAGIYTVSSRLTELIGFALVAVNQGAAPMISELHAQGRKGELQRLLSTGALGILAFSVPVALGMLLFGKMILGLFGEAFVAGYPPLIVLTAGQLVNALNTGGGFLMTMTGHEKQASLLIALSTIVNVGLNSILIPSFGIMGAAIATVTATAIWNVCLFFFAQRKLGINPTVWRFRMADTT